MTWARLGAAVTAGLSGVSAASSSTLDSPLQALDASPLFILQATVDPLLVWAKYERFLLSRSRSTPLLLYFTSSSTCYGEESEDGDEDEGSQGVNSPSIDQESCLCHQKLMEAAVELAAQTLSTPQLPVVRVDVQAWPKMSDYHLMSTTPSLLWMPGRASSRFQRYPHVETNFLDLSANGSLFAGYIREENEKNGGLQHSEVAKDAVAREITAFVRLCRERSGYLTRNARGTLSPTVPVNSGDDTFSGLELIPVLAFLAFIGLVVNENREFVLGLVQTRFFWFALCLGVIYVALSGLFHSIIHRRAWYYFGRMHGFVFVYPSSRRQFVLEGLVNGTWSFWLSLGVMSISDVAPTLKSRLAREEVIRWSLLLVAISYMALYFTFLMKYRWLA
ncbi:hypothetical protein F443_03176 [Phytophthora nicotianae P1569]|uniref:Uncharacterized protein n=2 Tax=Phytophthora nicotianae TaxID=4792 RepID=V9FR54_PHYNI|nr:hypothetical protein F443_03176 [Phytophthora nicotianae P1569]ETO82617.1 hypothetical protein F444_03243 [Phytophthora nicotianae P1976]